MKVAAVQMDIAWHNREANHAKARHFAKQAKAAGADLLVLPEMFSTGFSMDVSVTAETLDGPTPTLFRSIAGAMNMAVVGGFVLKGRSARPQNVSLAVGPGGKDLALYAKIHLIGILGEDGSYDPGGQPVPFGLSGTHAAAFVCYDLRFPELFRAVAAECGLIMVIASWPTTRQAHWDVLLRARAIENQCFVVGVNRVGEGGGLVFTGGSAIVDPLGQVLAHGGDRETLVMADLDLAKVKEVRFTLPFLKDRKPHLL
ncbi:MAG: Nitrilase/cyanide hydratase and apolipoprotein N-acyltransferase [Deltaproteobacteria bacterium]|nr:Nitrilase/cyanide hydratase and apolipoprotein N-acyltransferase [Deltaproteobacteria bacterium]